MHRYYCRIMPLSRFNGAVLQQPHFISSGENHFPYPQQNDK